MDFKASRASAVEKLENFVENNLVDYSKQRNFDYGPDERSNVSCLSPYVTCLLYTSPSPRDRSLSRMPSSA